MRSSTRARAPRARVMALPGQRPDRAVDVAHRASRSETAVPFAAASHGVVEEEPVEGPVEAVVLLDALTALIRVDGDQERRRSRSLRRSSRCSTRSFVTSPMTSSRVRAPSSARYSRTSSAMNSKKFSTNSGWPVKRSRSTRVLRRDADRAGVEVTDAHHDAARHDERCGGEAELLGPEQGGDDDVAAGLQLTVGLQHDAAAQAVGGQGLVRLGEARAPTGCRRA